MCFFLYVVSACLLSPSSLSLLLLSLPWHVVVSLSHHHVFFFVVAPAVAVTFATVAVVAAVVAKAPQLSLSLPQSLPLGYCRPSAVVDGVLIIVIIVVIGVIVVVHPPCAADAIIDVNKVAHLVHAAPGGSRPDP